jgi:DNA-directed RNA polymerase subunit RPC12/RpoP
MMFNIKCPHCGAKNDKERITCMECGKPFDTKTTAEEFTVAPAEDVLKEEEPEEEEEEA